MANSVYLAGRFSEGSATEKRIMKIRLRSGVLALVAVAAIGGIVGISALPFTGAVSVAYAAGGVKLSGPATYIATSSGTPPIITQFYAPTFPPPPARLIFTQGGSPVVYFWDEERGAYVSPDGTDVWVFDATGGFVRTLTPPFPPGNPIVMTGIFAQKP